MTIASIRDYETSTNNRLLEKIQERLKDPHYKPFMLRDSFVSKYKNVVAPFGFNGLGEIVYLRTYSRPISDNGAERNERWYETVERVVNGTYNMQKRWIQERGLSWDDEKGQDSAQEMYDRMFHMKFLPPGRGLWAMGRPITEERGLYAALNNCAFVSTINLKEDLSEPFKFLMDASMLGVGVGFDTVGARSIMVRSPDRRRRIEPYNIPDSREGWVDSVGMLIDSYFTGSPEVRFEYDLIRKRGELIKGFGGLSSGPEPLREAHEKIRDVLEKNALSPITSRTIVDIQNLIGKCVVAGNVRRTAEIAFGDPNDEEFLDLKNYKEKNPEREGYGWASNNSVFATLGMDYSEIERRILINGEPGIAWLENMRAYGRIKNGKNFKDHRVAGGNPCLEQSLESYELCCLVETFPFKHKSLEDFVRTQKFSYLYAKTVTLGETHWPQTNRVLLRNRRIGNSMSGIAQFITERGLDELIKWSEEAYKTIQRYDDIYSDWLTIPKSIKTTSIKPSGSVSLLTGATPGMHYPESEYYIRRFTLAKDSQLIKPLKDAGYIIEDAKYDSSSSLVQFPIHIGRGIRSAKEVSMWEQLSLAAFLQEHWADNQVSCTVTFDPETEGKQIANALNYFQYKLKGISFLPRTKNGAYEQMIYEAISQEQYKEMASKLKPIDFSKIGLSEKAIEKFCDGATCEIDVNGNKTPSSINT